ncbi:Segregation and condensation protein B [Planctomycetes bacterium Pan216]|uniref:Segregation and condensation protein B n=1 Tax=Kolteria novifilia TaxID=2527975 RepID=A0A518B6X9_9BACT|nr:Segregation and condensation protein B [Planctomycetes bacterium Pan216]
MADDVTPPPAENDTPSPLDKAPSDKARPPDGDRQILPKRGRLLDQVIEAILFVGDHALDPDEFVTHYPEIDASDVRKAARRLGARYRREHRPYHISLTDKGFQLGLLPERRRQILEQTRPDKGIKLSREAIEVLSVVAYKQPVTREEVSRFLGVESGSALRQLVKRRLLEINPSESGKKGTERYTTSSRFLELFGLKDLDDLPVTEDLANI